MLADLAPILSLFLLPHRLQNHKLTCTIKAKLTFLAISSGQRANQLAVLENQADCHPVILELR